MKLDLRNLFSQNLVPPKGIIHVGAYNGKDIKLYQTLNISKILFIEANPTVFETLKANITTASVDVQAVNYAISNQNGKIKLYVNSMEQSSSIFPLKHYRDIYPNIKETHQLIVESKTLDTLLKELELSPTDFNILNLDIQGAELLALEGATNLLQYIDAVYTKVNYEELYEGCALAEKIDEFLVHTGFGRVAVAKPFHPSWGDAFYVRKQVVTMSTLGKNGGLGNQIFQYAFLNIYSQENGLSIKTPKWLGQELFGHKDREIDEDLPVVVEKNNKIFPGNGEICKNVDIQGYFLYHTSYYRAHKEYFCSLFQPVAEIEAIVKVAWEKLRSAGKTIIGLHLQLHSDENNNSVVAPSEWYKFLLNGLWQTLEEPVLFIASDYLEEINQEYFAEYNPITIRDLEVEVNLEYMDFFLLSKCDFVAISNTAFAFAACLLNKTGKYFFRPHFSTAKLIPFEPWNSTPVFRDVDIDEVGKIVSSEAQFWQIQSQLQQTNTELQNSQSQKGELSKKLASTQFQLQQSQTELEKIQYQRDQILGELEQSQSQLQQNQEKAKNAVLELQQTRSELEKIQSQRDELSQQLTSTQFQLQQNQEKAKNAESELQQTRSELEKIQSQRDEFAQQLTSTQSQLQQNQEKAKNAESELQQTRSELEKIQSQRDEFAQQLASTQSQLQQNQEKAKNAESELQQTCSELEKIQSQRDEFAQQLTSTQSQLQQNQEKAKNAESELQQTCSELEKIQSQRDELSQQLTSTQSQLQQNQEKAKNAESQLQNIKTELDKSHSELHDMREELEITQFQLDEVQAELEQSQSQLSKHQEQLNTYQCQLQQTQIELEKTKLKLEKQEKILPNQNIKNYAAHIKNLAKILAETIPD